MPAHITSPPPSSSLVISQSPPTQSAMSATVPSVAPPSHAHAHAHVPVNNTKHFVWAWGRLTPTPLLLTPANNIQDVNATTSRARGGSRILTPRKPPTDELNTSTSSNPPEIPDATSYPFPSTTDSTVACTLSPTLVETMETHSVRAIHTAAYHTIAITHGGSLYSWLHTARGSGPNERQDGPATEETIISPTINQLSVTHVPKQRFRDRDGGSGPGSRSDSPVTVAPTSSKTVGDSSRNSSKNDRSSNLGSTPTANNFLISIPNAAPEKKFRKVLLTPTKSTGIQSQTASSPPAISAAALGRNQMLAVTTTGQVLQWDWSGSNELNGSPAASPSSSPSLGFSSSPSSQPSSTSAPSSINRGPTVLSLPSTGAGPTLVNGLACGGSFNLLVTGEGQAYSWGKLGTHGRLGQGLPPNIPAMNDSPSPATTTSSTSASAPSTPEKSTTASLSSLLTPRRSDSPFQERHAAPLPRPIVLPTPDALVSKVSAGWAHGALVLATGGVASFGCGLGGRLGSGNQLDQWSPQLVVGLDSIQIVEISCGYHHTMAIDVSGHVWCWGGNEHGQLGLGDRHARATPDTCPTAFPDEVVGISCGAFHTGVVTSVGDLYTFGLGTSGQLGFGDTKSSAQPRLVSSLNGMDVCLVACSGDYTIAVTDHFMVMQMDYFGGSSNDLAGMDEEENEPINKRMEVLGLDERSRSTSTASPTMALNTRSLTPTLLQSNRGISPSHHLSPSARVGRSNSFSSQQQQQLPSSLSTNLGGLRSSSPALPPPFPVVPLTPIIFEECDSSALPPPSNALSQLPPSWPHPNSILDDDTASAASEPPLTRIRTSSSSNALGELVHPTSIGAPNGLAKSASFTNGRHQTPSDFAPLTNTPVKSAVAVTFLESSASSNSIASQLTSHQQQQLQSQQPPQKKTIFQLVKEVFAFPPLIHPDLRQYIPTAKPVSSQDPVEPSDSAVATPSTMNINSSPSGSSFDDHSLMNMWSSPTSTPKRSASVITTPTSAGSSSPSLLNSRAEVVRMNAAYQVKLRKEAKGKQLLKEQEAARRKEQEKEHKAQMKKNLEREQRLDEAAEVWIKQILPNWTTMIRTKKVIDLIKKIGIPPRVRGVVWPKALGNTLMITQELYDIFGQQASRARKQRLLELKELNNAENGQPQFNHTTATAMASAMPSFGSSSSSGAAGLISSPSFTLGKESTFSYIDVDLTRTYPSLAFFQEGCPMNDQLRHLLYVYCFYRPDVGYVQGMSYLAGNLLLYMTPFDAFVSFAHLLNSPFFHVFLKLETSLMSARYRIFEEFFQDAEPELYKHFQNENIGSELYFMEWCMTLFCKRLKLDVVGRVWDHYLLVGNEAIVYKTGVAILRAMKSELLGAPFDKIMKKLNATPLELSEDELMSAMSDLKMSTSLKAKLKALNPLLQDE